MIISFSAATALMLDLPPMTLKMKLVDMAKEVKSLGIFGPFHPKFDMLQLFQKELTEMLPPDAHLKASNKVHISLTGFDVALNNFVQPFGSYSLVSVLNCKKLIFYTELKIKTKKQCKV